MAADRPHCSHARDDAMALRAAKLAGENVHMSFDHEEPTTLRMLASDGSHPRRSVARGPSTDRSSQSSVVRISLFALTVLGTACSTMGKPHFETYGIEKAAFDMQCDRQKLDVVELSSISVGVRGCGKQARYEMLRNGEWVLNSAQEASASGK